MRHLISLFFLLVVGVAVVLFLNSRSTAREGQLFQLAAEKQDTAGDHQWFHLPLADDATAAYATHSREVVTLSGAGQSLPAAQFVQAVFSNSAAFRALMREATDRLAIRVSPAAESPRYVIEYPFFRDMRYPQLVVSNNGRLVVGEASAGRLTFYGAGGEQLKAVSLFTESEYDL